MESVFAVGVIIGLLPAAIASGKGHSFLAWWFFGTFLFIVALPCSFFLKNITGKKCPSCAEYVATEARLCKHCRSEV